MFWGDTFMSKCATALGFCLMLAACGGGDQITSGGATGGSGTGGATGGNGGGSTGSSGTSTSTMLTDLRTSQVFEAASAQVYIPERGGSVGTSPRASFAAFGMAPSVTYDAAAGSYSFNDSPSIPAFSVGNQTSSDASFRNFTASDSAGSYTLMLFQPGTTNPRAGLSYASYGLLYSSLAAGTSNSDDYRRSFVYGFPTAASDVPRSGVATYSGTVDGYWVRLRSPTTFTQGYATFRISGTQSFTVDFTTGTVTVNLTLSGTDLRTTASLGTVDLGTFTGTGTIGSGNRLSGTISGAGFTAQFSGSLYGPGAAETAISFEGDDGSAAPASRQYIGGIVIGRKG